MGKKLLAFLAAAVSLVSLAACGGGGGGGASASEPTDQPRPAPPSPPIVSLKAENSVVQPGGTAKLNWESFDTTACTFPNVPESLAPWGSLTIGPLQSPAGQLHFTMTCTGPGGSASSTVTITIPHVLTSIVTIPDAYLFIADGESHATLTTYFYDQTGVQFADDSATLDLRVDGVSQPNLDFTTLLAGTYSFEVWSGGVSSGPFNVYARERKTYPVIELPIVFHLIHWGEPIGVGDNFSQTEVYKALNALNAAFANQLGSTDPNAVDLRVRFRAAAVGPDGSLLPEPGIDRIDGRPWDDGTDNPYGDPYGSIAGNDILEIYEHTQLLYDMFWDPREYVEVWVVPSSQNTFNRTRTYGNASLPILLESTPYPGLQNVLWAEPDPIASKSPPHFWIGALEPAYILAHEMGHHLGLLHPFSEGECDEGDFAADTYGYIRGTSIECEIFGVRGNHNTMDYFGANDTFTYDQRERIHWVLANAVYRRHLPFSQR